MAEIPIMEMQQSLVKDTVSLRRNVGEIQEGEKVDVPFPSIPHLLYFFQVLTLMPKLLAKNTLVEFKPKIIMT